MVHYCLKQKGHIPGADEYRIFIKADGYEEQSAPVRWSGLAFLNIFNGYKISPVTLAKDS